jgi:hypothetical protein
MARTTTAPEISREQLLANLPVLNREAIVEIVRRKPGVTRAEMTELLLSGRTSASKEPRKFWQVTVAILLRDRRIHDDGTKRLFPGPRPASETSPPASPS